MKKRGYFLSIIVVLLIGTMAFTSENVLAEAEWTEWKKTECLKGVDFRAKKGRYEMSRRARKWEFQFRNRYNATIYFNYKAISILRKDKMRSARTSKSRIQIEGNLESKVFTTYLKANKEIVVDLVKIRFGKNDVGKNYYKCDNVKNK
ncbi:MAG: hypothetical protein JKY44_08150 [Flavobacteriaceae bacterium]|nr:hypothetical protein [Flavobacteriaceae bacterium]